MLFRFSGKGAFTSARDSYHHALHAKKLGHDILRYVSKFPRPERDNYFFIGKKPSRKHFEKNSINLKKELNVKTENMHDSRH